MNFNQNSVHFGLCLIVMTTLNLRFLFCRYVGSIVMMLLFFRGLKLIDKIKKLLVEYNKSQPQCYLL